jgi:hypothetical protein
MTDFNGQTEKTGHFLQPTAMATGQSVMMIPNEQIEEAGTAPNRIP